MSIDLVSYDLFTPSSELGPYLAGDYFALPEDDHCELIQGRLYVSPSPLPLHQVVVALLAELIGICARKGGGVVLVAPSDVQLSASSVVQPDLFYITPARRVIIQDKIQGAPDLVIEVLSPATARRDRGSKLQLYAEAGVREYWLVDPQTQQIDFLINRGARFEVIVAQDDRYHSSELPEIDLKLASFWNDVTSRMAPQNPPGA